MLANARIKNFILVRGATVIETNETINHEKAFWLSYNFLIVAFQGQPQLWAVAERGEIWSSSRAQVSSSVLSSVVSVVVGRWCPCCSQLSTAHCSLAQCSWSASFNFSVQPVVCLECLRVIVNKQLTFIQQCSLLILSAVHCSVSRKFSLYDDLAKISITFINFIELIRYFNTVKNNLLYLRLIHL